MTSFRRLHCRAIRLAARFADDRSGATAIEYSLIIALIFLAIIGAVNSFTSETTNMYSKITSAMDR